MNNNAINNMRTEYETSSGLRDFFQKFETASSNERCDKHGASFNSDNRFSVFATNISFNSWTGYYGSSSCSTFSTQIDNKVASKLFILAVNEMKEDIFAKMAEIGLKQAKEMEAQARGEIEKMTALLNEVINDEAAES